MKPWDIAADRSDSDGFWVRVNPGAVNVFCNPLEHLRSSGWHEVASDGRFDLDRMAEENKRFLIHSLREQEPRGRGKWKWGWHKLYFRPSESLFVRVGTDFADFGNLSVWGIKQEDAAALSNMFNVADGLLGEFLNLHVICTINCEIEKLDPAIIRSGRLLESWQFRRLTAAEARRLSTAKGLNLQEQKDEYSLAEIYNGQSPLPNGGQSKAIGFR